MMNVYGALAEDQSESLAQKLSASDDLSNMILALLGRLIVICQKRGVPVEGLRLSPMDTRYEGQEFVIASHLTFLPLNLQPPVIWRPSTDFEAFAAARSQTLAMVLQRNPALGRFFQQLVEKIDAHAAHKGIPFSQLRIRHPFISTDDVLVIGIGKDAG